MEPQESDMTATKPSPRITSPSVRIALFTCPTHTKIETRFVRFSVWEQQELIGGEGEDDVYLIIQFFSQVNIYCLYEM